MPHRLYVTWLAWLDDQWNKPDRSDYYAMQIATEVRRVLSEKPERIKTNDFKMQFDFKVDKPLTQEEIKRQIKNRSLVAKSAWLAMIGVQDQKELSRILGIDITIPSTEDRVKADDPRWNALKKQSPIVLRNRRQKK